MGKQLLNPCHSNTDRLGSQNSIIKSSGGSGLSWPNPLAMVAFMRFSQLFAPTLRQPPAEAEVVSHQLLLRAGYIRRVTSGVYSYLPLMWRVLNKIQGIIRDELNKAGAQELLLPHFTAR
jgi:hypothetical protein